MSLAGRVSAAFLVLIALMVALAGYHLSLVHRLHDDNRRLIQVELEISRTGLALRRTIDRLTRLTQIFFVRRDSDYPAEMQRLRDVVEEGIDHLRALRLTADERAVLARFAVAWRDYATAAPGVEAEFLDLGSTDKSPVEALGGLDARLIDLDRAARRAMEARIEASAAKAAKARATAWTATTTAAAAAIVLALLLAGSVARPLARLGRGTHEMAQGNFAFRVAEAGSRELASLAREFNAMADRLGELDRLKKDFVSSVSHDLKAPLASMQETTVLLLEGTPGPLAESQRRLLSLNRQCGERLSAMIGDLLEAARLEAGSVEFDLAAEDLAEVARQALAEAGGSIGARRLELDARLDPAPIAADRDLLLRLLWNLLSNAVKFSPEGGRLVVRTGAYAAAGELEAAFPRHRGALAPPVAVCEIEDAGPGIPDAEKEHVFDRFHRADPRRRGVQGSGLGLAIAHHLARGHGGELWVEDAVGSATGSRFALVLPLRGEPNVP